MIDPLRIVNAARNALSRRWPRRFVLRGTNVPVELVHIIELDEEARCIIRLPDGSQMRITAADLGSRPMLGDGAVPMSCTLVLAGVVAALSAPPAALQTVEVVANACMLVN